MMSSIALQHVGGYNLGGFFTAQPAGIKSAGIKPR
jgi:hypothetical protein